MIITTTMLWEAIQEQRKMLEKILKKDMSNDFEEVALWRACKGLHLGQKTVIDLITRGELKARIDENGRYRIRLADIRAFQDRETRQPERVEVESAEDIARRIFGTNKRG